MKKNNRSHLAYRDTFFAGRVGIRGKILIYLLVLAGFMLSLVWVSQSALLFSIFERSAAGQMTSTAGQLRKHLDDEDAESFADRLGAENDLGIWLLNARGEVIFSAGRTRYTPFENLDQEKAQSWIKRAPQNGKIYLESVSYTVDLDDQPQRDSHPAKPPESEERALVLLQRMTQLQTKEEQVLLLSARITPLRTTRNAMRNQFLLMTLAVLLATGLVGYSMANSVSEPIIETNEAALALSRSRYTRPPHSGGYREIAELNDTLVRTAEDLRRVEDLQRELIANISHDLRTPLTMIEGYVEAMRDIPDENTPENLQIIIDETKRLSSMVNEVLDFSRLRTGNLEMKKSRFDLTELIRSICERVSKMSGVEGYTVVFDGREPCFVEADSGRIGQVIYNLLGNALTYTGKDQTVTVQEEKRDGRIRVSISDSGEGIAPDELPYIWDRYYRSRENHRRAIIGSGLGLNICRSILEKHEAPFGVDSKVGQGTIFWFELDEKKE